MIRRGPSLTFTFSTSPLKPWTEFNKTWQKARSQRPLPSLCFSGWLKKQDGSHSLWLAETFSNSPLKPWTEFNKTWQKARSQRPLPSLCFSGRSNKQDGSHGHWLTETFSLPLLKPLNGIQRNLTGSKISTSSTKFVFFRPIGKTRWRPWPLIGWDIINFSETAKRNSTKLDRKQDLNAIYQVCVFQAIPSEKQDGHQGLWMVETFSTSPLIPLNGIQGTLTESKILTSSTKLVFFGPIGKLDGGPGLWLAETFSPSPLKPLNWIQRNLTGSKISTSSTKFLFFRPIGKTRWQPWPLIAWDIFNSSSETAKRNSMKLDRKQDLNVLYQVCVFRADWKNKMAVLDFDWLRHFRLLLWNHWIEFNETWQEARSQHHLPSFFLGGGRGGTIGKTRWRPWPLMSLDILDFTSETAGGSVKNLSNRWHVVLRCMICGPLGPLSLLACFTELPCVWRLPVTDPWKRPQLAVAPELLCVWQLLPAKEQRPIVPTVRQGIQAVHAEGHDTVYLV